MKATLVLSFLLSFSNLSFSADQPINVPEDWSKLIQFPVEKFQLENGLTVLVAEDHSVPIVSFQQWFRVGSKDEKPGRTGLAHFFEHLMFKGTEKYDNGIYDQIVQSNGGTNNAFTSYDYTAYYINLPSDKLEAAIDLESDRMANLQFEEDEIKREREVVKEERRMRTDNSIMGYLNEKLIGLVYKVHPYRSPVIGYMRDLNAATIDDMKAFYRSYYAPNNAVVVVSGDVTVSEVKSLVKKYYGSMPSQKLPEPSYKQEPEQKAARSLTLNREVQSPIFTVAYQAPRSGDKDAYALDLLSKILSDGRSSRLYKRLVYQTELTNSISSYNYTPKDPGIFRVTGFMKPGKDLEKAISAVYGEIYKLRKELVSKRELEKVKNQIMFDYVESLKTVSGRANTLAINELYFGDYSQMFKDLEKYRAVTREDIKNAAAKYLMPQQRSTIRIVPKSQEGA